MFNHLRIRMTMLYALSTLAAVALVGGGGYLVVARYFRDATDLALQHKMAYEFAELNAPIPDSLANAAQEWTLVRDELRLLPSLASGPISRETAIARAQTYVGGGRVRKVEQEEHAGTAAYEVVFSDGREVWVARETGAILGSKGEDGEEGGGTVPDLGAFDAELAAIFVLPLDGNGRILFRTATDAPIAPDTAALQQALAGGYDTRTTSTADGQRVRLLTYRLTRGDGPAALQLGRVLTDQEAILQQLLGGLMLLGTVSLGLVGVASWWLAGRSLRPAEQAWKRQQQFIASASHELRTPLTLIRASTEVALRSLPGDDDDQRSLLADVLAESDHMRRLVDDLLMLSRLDSQQVPLTPASVPLLPLCEDVQRQISRMQPAGPVVQLAQVEGHVYADAARLRQVLLILIDNALRYTPPDGQITVSSSVQGRLAHLQVSDTGCGIAPEHLPHIFERFYRADAARGRETGNAGLGLSIARGLIQAMHGSITAHSRPGHGTTIQLVLPAAQD